MGASCCCGPGATSPPDALASVRRRSSVGRLMLPETKVPWGAQIDRPETPPVKVESLVVVLRVRPLHLKEREEGERRCIEVMSRQELIFRPVLMGGDESPPATQFTFDGVLPETGSQDDVFLLHGPMMARKALDGINCTLFAYGQTGSGKTHTISGTDEDPGFMPRFIDQLFRDLDERRSSQRLNITLTLTYVEIYNETLIDLFRDSRPEQPDEGRPTIRETVDKQIVLENVIVQQASSSEQVLQLVRRGSARRTTAETRANEASSRSHAVLTLHLSQVSVDDEDGLATVTSKVNLVDLAGSERVKATGATGDRLREGGSINQSLLVLGKVASALTSPEAAGHRHVPYRESKLTRILQDSLGGNAFTVMCCNVSPAPVHEQETLNALRFAERVKKIRNKVRVNIDPAAQKIQQLLRENQQLRAYIEELEARLRGAGQSSAPTPDNQRRSVPPRGGSRTAVESYATRGNNNTNNNNYDNNAMEVDGSSSMSSTWRTKDRGAVTAKLEETRRAMSS